MSDMVAKVAKAILDAAKVDGGGFAYVNDDGDGCATLDGQFDLNVIARAAIEATRTPNERMLEAVGKKHETPFDQYFKDDSDLFRWAKDWHEIMIDAALKEEDQ